MTNEIFLVFHVSNYDYHFIIQELANEFAGQYKCPRENTEKYKTFSVSIKREVLKIEKDGNESVVTISYKIVFVDSRRFMAISLSNLADNLTERIHKIKCKDCDCCLKSECLKNNSIKYKCLSYNNNYSNKIDEEIQEHI